MPTATKSRAARPSPAPAETYPAPSAGIAAGDDGRSTPPPPAPLTDYAAGLKNLALLQASQRELQEQLRKMQARSRIEPDSGAAKLVVGLEAQPTAEPEPEPAFDPAELQCARLDLETVERAIVLQAKANERLRRERDEAACRQAEPLDREHLTACVRAAKALQQAHDARERHLAAIIGTGVELMHPLAPGLKLPPNVCNAWGQSSYLSRFIEQAKELGVE